ncbi:MAG: TetR/AcrR family transcriptional regulator [Phycisphaerales bacterium]
MAQQDPTRDRLLRATINLVSRSGPRGVSIRSIAREAGVTEGAVYRHFKSKDDLWREAHTVIVDEMLRQKEAIVASGLSAREKLAAWIRSTFANHDRNPEAFYYALLADHRAPAILGPFYHRQGELFQQLVRNGQASGELRAMDPVLAMSHFSGLMLNVTRLVHEGALAAPASRYTDEVARAAWLVLGART